MKSYVQPNHDPHIDTPKQEETEFAIVYFGRVLPFYLLGSCYNVLQLVKKPGSHHETARPTADQAAELCDLQASSQIPAAKPSLVGGFA